MPEFFLIAILTSLKKKTRFAGFLEERKGMKNINRNE